MTNRVCKTSKNVYGKYMFFSGVLTYRAEPFLRSRQFSLQRSTPDRSFYDIDIM
jgi:hypothetical protein